MSHLRKLLLYVVLTVPIAVAATWGIDHWQNRPVPERPIIDPAERDVAREAAAVVLDSWATDPGMYDDAQLLADYVQAGFDDRPVTADWIRERFGHPSMRLFGEQWNLPTGRSALYVRIEPDGDIVVWQRAVVLDNPTRGELFRAMRSGGIEDYRGIQE